MSKFCCLFNHYNPNNSINRYIFEILTYFNSSDCETIIISNSPLKAEKDIQLLKQHFKGKFIERENTGFDFAAWQHAIDGNMIPPDTEYLFLINDSIFGPLFDLDPIVKKMISDESIDFWGLSDSYQFGWHLQSYFLCFKRNVFTSNAFRDFFKQEFVRFNKTEVINNGEVLLTTTLVKAGFKGKAFVEYDTLMKHTHIPFRNKNPMHFFVDTLIKKYRFPFIKKEVVFVNPEGIEIEGGFINMLENETTYPTGFIKEAFVERCLIDETVSTPVINVMCHLFYLNTAYNFLYELKELKRFECRFFFNLSADVFADREFINILLRVFKGCVIMKASNIGKDIGGKLAMMDLSTRLGNTSEYTIFLHDKQSLHTSLGKTWRKKLFRIIEKDKILAILNIFATDSKAGIVAANEFIINEYNSSSKEFECTSNRILKRLISEYGLTNKNFDFVGGTMFWIRTEILNNFFSKYKPLEIRSTLEKGNVLDHKQGTETHAWERILSWIALDKHCKIKGINE